MWYYKNNKIIKIIKNCMSICKVTHTFFFHFNVKYCYKHIYLISSQDVIDDIHIFQKYKRILNRRKNCRELKINNY